MILSILISLLAVAGFGFALWRTRIMAISRDAVAATSAGLSTMMDSELEDDAKEAAVRRAGFRLLMASFSIFWRLAVALASALAPILLADWLGLVPQDRVFGLMLRLDYIVIVSVLAIVLVKYLGRGAQAQQDTTSEFNRYSPTDRFFHALAFSSPAVLKGASALEDRLGSAPTEAPSAPPVFVTSLARGGTTALLNALYDIPQVATHTYRDMPFLTAPLLWNRLAGGRKRDVARHQRAHGDGLEIDLDSPEAFEEIVWKMFWPEKFKKVIAPWQPKDSKPEAETFLTRHMAKVIRARQTGPKPLASVYCSKNNANIARIPYLVQAFAGCRIVVPVRRPESHAASLLRQHQNFLKLQSEDDFIRRYMRDIGHFEFGQIHKPIQFPGFDASAYDPTTPDYWLHYWITAFEDILQHAPQCHFVLQDALRSAPQETMTQLCTALKLDAGTMQFSDYFRPGSDQSATDIYDPALYAKAADLYGKFEALAQEQPAPKSAP